MIQQVTLIKIRKSEIGVTTTDRGTEREKSRTTKKIDPQMMICLSYDLKLINFS
jgi:hypothetical protein